MDALDVMNLADNVMDQELFAVNAPIVTFKMPMEHAHVAMVIARLVKEQQQHAHHAMKDFTYLVINAVNVTVNVNHVKKQAQTVSLAQMANSCSMVIASVHAQLLVLVMEQLMEKFVKNAT